MRRTAASGHRGTYEVTVDRSVAWHASGGRRCCNQGRHLVKVVAAHLESAGFTVVSLGRHHVNVTGPRIRDRQTKGLFAAVSGRPVAECEDRPLSVPRQREHRDAAG